MGMFDTINGEQVKCFGIPIYYSSEFIDSVSQTGGALRYFNDNDIVPYKTYYYNYTKDFAIVDTSPENEKDIAIIHIIRNGKVLKTVNLKKLKDKDLIESNKIIDYFGIELNIKSKQQILEKIEYYNEYLNELKKITKEENKIFKDEVRTMQELSKIETEKGKDSKEYKETEQLFYFFKNQHDEEQKKINPLIDKLKEKYINIFYKDMAEINDCIKLGEYIAAEIDYYNKKIKPDLINKMKIYILKKINNKTLVNNFCKWQEISLEEFEKIIADIKNQKNFKNPT